MKKLVVGITGGIGSGKSVVARIMSTLGYPVYNADDEAGNILEKDQKVIDAVKKLIGEKAYSDTGKPDRVFISSVVFNDRDKLESLNTIIHPAVQTHFMNWVEKNTSSCLVFKEAAIMFESGSYKAMNRVIAVTAPQQLKISRVMERDGKTEAQVKKIIDKQLPQDELEAKSDFVIVNDENQLLIPQVIAVLDKLKTELQ